MKHASHPAIIKRLKRASGHLSSVIEMMEQDRPCVDLAQQLYAVESAITNAKRELIQDHIEHCLTEDDPGLNLSELKVLARYL